MATLFRARRPEHAISEFALTVTLWEPITPSLLAEITQQLSQKAQSENLPNWINSPALQVKLGDNADSQEIGGAIGFQRFAPDGSIDEGIFIDSRTVTYKTQTYLGWPKVLPRAVDLISYLLSFYRKEMPAIRNISIHYFNDFRNDQEGAPAVCDLFREGSIWVAPFVHGMDDLWHCNVGRFISASKEPRKLVQVNSSLLRSPFPPFGKELVHARIIINVFSQFDAPGSEAFIINVEDIRSALTSHLNELHDIEKNIIQALLRDEYLSMIGANK